MSGAGQADLFDQETGLIRLSDQQRLDWLRLIRTERVGPRTFRDLINHFGGAEAALEALPGLSRQGGLARPVRIPTRGEAEAEMAQALRLNVSFVALGEADYPSTLRAMNSPPPLIAVRGHLAALSRPMVAIVGSRNASAAGIAFTRRLAHELADSGFVIVSGLARGIDACAHEASLATGTVAALAGGHDRIYPPEHEPLCRQLCESGVALSEMPMGWIPKGRDFPRRNRLIAGLSYGVVVVEAAERSGSLITARLAGEEGREVFAVPGSPLDPRAAGTNRLLKQGATLVTGADDVISALAPMIGTEVPLRSSSEPETSPYSGPLDPSVSDRQMLVGLLGPSPVMLDDLVRASRLSVPLVRIMLLELELAGRISIGRGGHITMLPPSP
jgi:DNA processing protein